MLAIGDTHVGMKRTHNEDTFMLADEDNLYVVADGIAEKRAVTLGRRIPGFVVINSGLTAGEAVITEGTHKVRDGSPVKESG